MKIRTNFVTNSSSYSSAEIRIDNPVLLEILSKYDALGAFESDCGDSWAVGASLASMREIWGDSWFEDDDGNNEGEDDIVAFVYYNEETAPLGSPKNLDETVEKILDIIAYDERNLDNIELFRQCKEELIERADEIVKAYIDVKWEARNDSYGESEPEPGDKISWEFTYNTKNGEQYCFERYMDDGSYDEVEIVEEPPKSDNINDNYIKKSVAKISILGTEGYLEKYQGLIEVNPEITFNGKLFVFSGVDDFFMNKKYRQLVDKIVELGGDERSCVSGKTDYLVINPEKSGESKIKAAKEQKEKGKLIKVVLFSDLEKALEDIEKLSAEKGAKKNETPADIKNVESPKKITTEIDANVDDEAILKKFTDILESRKGTYPQKNISFEALKFFNKDIPWSALNRTTMRLYNEKIREYCIRMGFLN